MIVILAGLFKKRFRAFKFRSNGGVMRFKQNKDLKKCCNLFTYLLYFSKKHEKQKKPYRETCFLTQKCKRKLLTTVENLCNFLHLFKISLKSWNTGENYAGSIQKAC